MVRRKSLVWGHTLVLRLCARCGVCPKFWLPSICRVDIGEQAFTLTFTPTDYWKSSIDLKNVFLECGRNRKNCSMRTLQIRGCRKHELASSPLKRSPTFIDPRRLFDIGRISRFHLILLSLLFLGAIWAFLVERKAIILLGEWKRQRPTLYIRDVFSLEQLKSILVIITGKAYMKRHWAIDVKPHTH